METRDNTMLIGTKPFEYYYSCPGCQRAIRWHSSMAWSTSNVLPCEACGYRIEYREWESICKPLREKHSDDLGDVYDKWDGAALTPRVEDIDGAGIWLRRPNGEYVPREDIYELGRLLKNFYNAHSDADLQDIEVGARINRGQHAITARWNSFTNQEAVPGYVYLLSTEASLCKIGQTTTLDNRVKTLAIQAPYKVTLAHAITVDNVRMAEQLWHIAFQELRMNGEWFQLKPYHIEGFKKIESMRTVPDCKTMFCDRNWEL